MCKYTNIVIFLFSCEEIVQICKYTNAQIKKLAEILLCSTLIKIEIETEIEIETSVFTTFSFDHFQFLPLLTTFSFDHF